MIPLPNSVFRGFYLLCLSQSICFSIGFTLPATNRNCYGPRTEAIFRSLTQLDAKSTVSFSSPLLDSGYPPAVSDLKSNNLLNKPLLVYLPGFDGTLLAPFLQFPELGTEFDVKGMTVSMDDRSSVEELKNQVITFIDRELQKGDNNKESKQSSLPLFPFLSEKKTQRPVFLVGESFGGILALEVGLLIEQENAKRDASRKINLQMITLINPATSYNESNLVNLGPPLTKVSPLLYPFQLLKLLPLFTDAYGLPQLLLILQSKGLPSVIDNEQREAYMGRTALSLPTQLEFMPQQTLKWRLEEWLEKGCASISKKEQYYKNLDMPILIVAGEKDNTLPSVAEASRLSGLFRRPSIHIVDGAGHGCTAGSRVDLTALIRKECPKLLNGGRTEMKEAACNPGEYFGMEPRYDNANIGLMPTLYWSKDNYQSAT